MQAWAIHCSTDSQTTFSRSPGQYKQPLDLGLRFRLVGWLQKISQQPLSSVGRHWLQSIWLPRVGSQEVRCYPTPGGQMTLFAVGEYCPTPIPSQDRKLLLCALVVPLSCKQLPSTNTKQRITIQPSRQLYPPWVKLQDQATGEDKKPAEKGSKAEQMGTQVPKAARTHSTAIHKSKSVSNTGKVNLL